MKKALLLVSMIVVLIAASLTGVVFHAAAAPGPSLSATAIPGMNVRVTGMNWSTTPAVSLYLDTVAPVQLLATVMPMYPGTFNITLSIPAISIGPHQIIGVQGFRQVPASFTPLATSPVDDRVWAVLQGLGDTSAEVGNIEDKLDGTHASLLNGANGLEAIKTDTGKIWDEVNNAGHGLAEIKTEVADIQTKVTDVQTKINDGTNGLAAIKSNTNLLLTDTNSIIHNTAYGLMGSNGLEAIKFDTNNIWDAVNDTGYGLQEIKSEVISIEGKLDNANSSLAAINDKADDIKNDTSAIIGHVSYGLNGLNGLPAIKAEVDRIEGKLDGTVDSLLNNSTFGLSAIENLLTDSDFGLNAIKTLEININTGVESINSQLMDSDHGLNAIVNAYPYGLKEIKAEIIGIETDINYMQNLMATMWSYIQTYLPPDLP